MSYSFDTVEVHAQGASYIDRILKGASLADLPVQQPTKYSLILNLKTAETLGLTIPQLLLARADEVIEWAGLSGILDDAVRPKRRSLPDPGYWWRGRGSPD
jgi:hypothetical protein